MKQSDYIKLLAGFLVTLLFATIDNGVSPLVDLFHDFFGVPHASVLNLISACTIGLAAGLFIGPALLAMYAPRRILAYANVGVAISVILFVLTPSFLLALTARALFGLSVGLLSAVIWWFVYHRTSGKKAQDAMLTAIMSARPMGIALGVPALGLLSVSLGWQPAFAIAGVALLGMGGLLYAQADAPAIEKSGGFSSFFSEYPRAARQPYFFLFFGSVLLNSMAYLGFYALGGLWFLELYHLSSERIATLFLYFGLAEVVATFLSPILLRKFDFEKLFVADCVLSFILYVAFIGGSWSLGTTLLLIMGFIATTRLWIFSNVSHIPMIFPTQTNKGTLGTLMTLFAWIGFASASALQSFIIPRFGIHTVTAGMALTLLLSFLCSLYVHKRMTFNAEEPWISAKKL